MSTDSYEPILLTLARTGADLRPAVEAAQFARLFNHERPASEDEAKAMAAFLTVFADCAETWEAVPPPTRPIALDGFARYIGALERHGLFVHSGIVKRDFAVEGQPPRPLPLAVVNLGRQPLPAMTVMLPAALDVTA